MLQTQHLQPIFSGSNNERPENDELLEKVLGVLAINPSIHTPLQSKRSTFVTRQDITSSEGSRPCHIYPGQWRGAYNATALRGDVVLIPESSQPSSEVMCRGYAFSNTSPTSSSDSESSSYSPAASSTGNRENPPRMTPAARYLLPKVSDPLKSLKKRCIKRWTYNKHHGVSPDSWWISITGLERQYEHFAPSTPVTKSTPAGSYNNVINPFECTFRSSEPQVSGMQISGSQFSTWECSHLQHPSSSGLPLTEGYSTNSTESVDDTASRYVESILATVGESRI